MHIKGRLLVFESQLHQSSSYDQAVMTLGKLLDLSKPQFLDVLNGHKNINYFIGLL